jgi:hypothetical protein
MNRCVTHTGFADESHWNIGRFRSLGLVTLRCRDLPGLESKLRDLLNQSGIQEFKWKKLDGAKERIAAQKLCKFTVENACACRLRVDVLIWDTYDSRHAVPRRDDIANLQRMYYHLFLNVLRARWPDDAVWRLHPDEHTALKWQTVQDCLERVSTTVQVDGPLIPGGQFRARLRKEFSVEEIQPVSSKDHPLLQLADLFAGVAVFSREKFHEYQSWDRTTSPQEELFEEAQSGKDPSQSSRERFQVVRFLDNLCKRRKLGVSLKRKQGFWTANPQRPINFWLYKPQHQADKAPQKTSP